MTQDVLFDASRLLSRTERRVPTGVDRVCLAYAEWLLARPDVRMLPVRSKNDQLQAVDRAWFANSVRDLRARWTGNLETDGSDLNVSQAAIEASSEARLFAALSAERPGADSVRSPAPPHAPDRSAVRRLRVWKQFFRSRSMSQIPAAERYFNVGHTSLNSPEILQSLNDRGVETVVMLHDLIPITHPEFCRPGDGDKHRVRVLTALRHASRILVNSDYTALELMRFADAEGLNAPPIDAVHLGLEPSFQIHPTQATPRPYFVHVGTIEARKNLAFLLTIWRRLQETLGPATPQLVLVGRYGWENEAVLDHLERSPALRGLVHQSAELPDSALATLMSNAQAVLAPSSVEGFDLPAVEAMALGVPLIASDIPAHRELVPGAELIDPLDGLGWLAALERATLKRPLAPAYTAPTWAAHFRRVESQIGDGPI